MKADERFLQQSKEFWANVRAISQAVGYTRRGTGEILIPTIQDIRPKFRALNLSTEHIATHDDALTPFGTTLVDYFAHRANVLNQTVRTQLMNARDAELEFETLLKSLQPKCPLPLNKQKGGKRKYNFLTCLVNMLIEANIGDAPCNYDPKALTTVTYDRKPLRTLSRRVDGAFSSIVNPIAIWEIKEYYYTTTFGSRVADGVYESLLDGMELEELEAQSKRKIYHVLFVDAYYTWWDLGRSYLCRLIDMLHMGFVDEVIFGREVLARVPVLAAEWRTKYDELEKETTEPIGATDDSVIEEQEIGSDV